MFRTCFVKMGNILLNVICILLLISLCLTKEEENDNKDILCTASVCEEYIEKNPCPKVSDNCKIQNATHSGLFLPHNSPCNCCKICVDNLALDDVCILGTPDGPMPDMICGDGLFCDPTTSTCVSNPTPCMKAQEQYDNDKNTGKLGFLQIRPQCDKRGKFLQVTCIPGEICFCVDKDGERIFGEMPYNIQALDLTKCGCSRNVHNINKVLDETKYSSLRPKCLSDGNFDSVQCTNKKCVCVDESNGGPTDLKMKPVNIHLASEMECFNNASHPEGVYLNACEKKYNEILEDVKYKKEIGFSDVLGYILPNCQLDGRYAAVQETKTTRYCADPSGKQLEKFVVEKTNILSKTINCYCARSRSIIPWHEKPDCCDNGNYKRMQCRRGKCYCVDTNGLQIEKEVSYEARHSLTCAKEGLCTEI